MRSHVRGVIGKMNKSINSNTENMLHTRSVLKHARHLSALENKCVEIKQISKHNFQQKCFHSQFKLFNDINTTNKHLKYNTFFKCCDDIINKNGSRATAPGQTKVVRSYCYQYNSQRTVNKHQQF